ncbi:YecA family protein [Metabacillus fastidiosus]|uniref:YecA family protein n=1 Tax=Metabacillus fastidiosus TaxID=1458 RepID=UPI002E1DA8CF|nr:SEC-C metal-binding domain-containing protein [Metabacillus fastidiosus]MED4455994.1 SEC-C metal-binding domain-containing protein [Metabacillus fastidiosus]
MMGISRNGPCFCGSGEKYKKCCMKKNVVSLDSIRDGELNQFQYELLEFAMNHYGEELSEITEDIISDQFLDGDEEELITFLLTVWGVFSFTIDDGQTIIDQFITQKKNEKSIRMSSLTQLTDWKNTFPSLCEVTRIINEREIEVKDIFTNEKRNVKLIEKDDTIQKDGLIIGFLVPYGKHYSYFTIFLDFPADETPDILAEIYELYDQAEYDDYSIFMRDLFPAILMKMVLGEVEEELSMEQLRWDNPKYEETALLFQKMMEEEELPEQIAHIGVMFWYLYCKRESPSIRKPEIYAAALHYFVDINTPFPSFYTDTELSDLYGVRLAAMLTAYRGLEDSLADEIQEMDHLLEYGPPLHDIVEGALHLENNLLPFIPRKK